MKAISSPQDRLIGWNGVIFHISNDWEVRVSGSQFLIFEKDFIPQLQLRWENGTPLSRKKLNQRLAEFAGPQNSSYEAQKIPSEWHILKKKFDTVYGYQRETNIWAGGVCICTQCNTLIHFQLLSEAPSLIQEVGDCLATLSCHDFAGNLWQLQDFKLITPSSFKLKDFTFGAGLTRISFKNGEQLLHTCRLAQADSRLAHQQLGKILISLTGTPDLDLTTDGNSCHGQRSPNITKQILLRLKREKPFHTAKIWHDGAANRLLTVALSSNRPISQQTLDSICRDYEIVQEETAT